jgi:hypothetical protein
VDRIEEDLLKFRRMNNLKKKMFSIQKRDCQQIRKFLEEHHVHCLCHFTYTRNIRSILEHGILSKLWSYRNNIKITRTGNQKRERFDNSVFGVSLSISFPNYLMFYKLLKHSQETMCVLFVSTDVLIEQPCLFFPENSFQSKFDRLEDFGEKLMGVRGLKNMFDSKFSHPADPQAEVVVFNHVPAKYIYSMAFRNKHDRDEALYKYSLGEFSKDVLPCVNNTWFRYPKHLRQPWDDDAE